MAFALKKKAGRMKSTSISAATVSELKILMNIFKEEYPIDEKIEQKPNIMFGVTKEIRFVGTTWINENHKRFFAKTLNGCLLRRKYFQDIGFITCMIYTPDGENVIVGHITGAILVGVDLF